MDLLIKKDFRDIDTGNIHKIHSVVTFSSRRGKHLLKNRPDLVEVIEVEVEEVEEVKQDLSGFSYRELQALARKAGVQPNQKKDKLLEALS